MSLDISANARAEELFLEQENMYALISELLAIAQALPGHNFDLADLDTRLNLLETYWSEAREKNTELQAFRSELKNNKYFVSNVFSTIQSNYLTSKAAFTCAMGVLRAASGIAPPAAQAEAPGAPPGIQAAPNHQAALEKLQLPRFDGKQADWQVFKDKFTSLVINDTYVSPVIKLQRLHQNLDGDAGELLGGIRATAENFELSWATLCRQYDNIHRRLAFQLDLLFHLPSTDVESVKHLNQLITVVKESRNVFQSLACPVDNWDHILIHCIVSKVAASTLHGWAKELGKNYANRFPTAALEAFLEERVQTLLISAEEQSQEAGQQTVQNKQSAASGQCAGQPKASATGQKPKGASAHFAAKQKNNIKKRAPYALCSEPHFIGYCPKFISASNSQRMEQCKSAKLCFNCLGGSHGVESCTSKGRCMICNEKHHTRLHLDKSTAKALTATLCHVAREETAQVSTVKAKTKILPTALVILQSATGDAITIRALLDPGAEECFVTEQLALRLSLPKHRDNVSIFGVGGTRTAVANSRVSLYLKSRIDDNFLLGFSALVLKTLTSLAPRRTVQLEDWLPFKDICLADPDWGTPDRIDCILDAEVFANIVRPGLEAGPPGDALTAINSVLGWLIMGGKEDTETAPLAQMARVHLAANRELSKALTRFWEVENVPTLARLTPEEEACYSHFKETHTRNAEGRFVVRLPFFRQIPLSDTRYIAESSFKRLEGRFSRQPEVAVAYKDFMDEYLHLNHMAKVPEEQVTKSFSSYLPHHPVFKRDNPNKIRVVFNASQKNFSKISLNSLLHVGPKLQEDVLAIIVRWSFFPVVFTCNIVKMFRQFGVQEKDCDWQRILWRNSVDEPVQTYKLNTVTYGTACAPFLANACMLQLAEDEATKYTLGATAIRLGRYADDFFTGGDHISDALAARDQLISILTSAKMEVGKWASNAPALLPSIIGESESKDTSVQDDVVSALGIRWNLKEDFFFFKVRVEDFARSESLTKRTVSSQVAKLYDPIGWLAPVVIESKIFLQNLWRHGEKDDWDKQLSEENQAKWIQIQSGMKDIESIRIPRHNNLAREVLVICKPICKITPNRDVTL